MYLLCVLLSLWCVHVFPCEHKYVVASLYVKVRATENDQS